jgi:hypothetical protein
VWFLGRLLIQTVYSKHSPQITKSITNMWLPQWFAEWLRVKLFDLLMSPCCSTPAFKASFVLTLRMGSVLPTWAFLNLCLWCPCRKNMSLRIRYVPVHPAAMRPHVQGFSSVGVGRMIRPSRSPSEISCVRFLWKMGFLEPDQNLHPAILPRVSSVRPSQDTKGGC